MSNTNPIAGSKRIIPGLAPFKAWRSFAAHPISANRVSAAFSSLAAAFLFASSACGADRDTVLATMKRATTFMVEEVSHEGGYVWNYLPDFSRRWGEMEAYPTMVWMQPPGTPGMGTVFLEAYQATGDEYYYEAASKAADALIRVQHESGGWNYVADLAGEESLRKWYDTIGRNGWRLEEFQHYYGNATFDDRATTATAQFILRLYLVKREAKYRASLDLAIQFVMDSQYPSGGWPQRFPPMGGFSKQGNPDYTSFITFNDDVAVANLDFLIECHQVLGEEHLLLEPIHRAMNSFVSTQQRWPQAGWAMQYTPELEPAGARTYEPRALSSGTTVQNIGQLIRFYHLSGDTNFLARIPEAFEWLDSVKFAPDTEGIRGTHPTFVEIGSNRPLFVHRRGSNVRNGRYYADQDPRNTTAHYSSFRTLDVDGLRERYKRALATPPDEATKNSPLKTHGTTAKLPQTVTEPQEGVVDAFGRSSEERADLMVRSLGKDGYWPARLRHTSHPHMVVEPPADATGDFATTLVGDESDTSPYRNTLGTLCISVSTYIRNMHTLIRYLEQAP